MGIEVLNDLNNDFRPLIIEFIELLASEPDQTRLQRGHITEGSAGQLTIVSVWGLGQRIIGLFLA